MIHFLQNWCLFLLILALFFLTLTVTKVSNTSPSETNTCYAGAQAIEEDIGPEPGWNVDVTALVVCRSQDVYNDESTDGWYDLRASIQVPGPDDEYQRKKSTFYDGCDVDIELFHNYWLLDVNQIRTQSKGFIRNQFDNANASDSA